LLLLAALKQVYSENEKEKAEQKDLKYLQFGPESLYKIGVKEGMVSEENNVIFLKKFSRWEQWLTPVIPTTLEAEIRGMEVQTQLK
jgi:hypothetical protein